MQAQNTTHEPFFKVKYNPEDGLNRYVIIPHGAINGVTGSCQVRVSEGEAVLIDCGLLQGQEAWIATACHQHGQDGNPLIGEKIPFSIAQIKALIDRYVHIDRVEHIPHLLAAGFKAPIYCSELRAKLLPLILECAVKVAFTRNQTLMAGFISTLTECIVPVTYDKWKHDRPNIKKKIKPAGHFLVRDYMICNVSNAGGHPVPESFKVKLKTSVRAPLSVKAPKSITKIISLSGDLGAPTSPRLKAPVLLWHNGALVMESIFGDTIHQNLRQQLKQIIEKALVSNHPRLQYRRTQELLYELE
ncbi:MAG: hypothetical protein RPS47_03150 [Colwellia sp.]